MQLSHVALLSRQHSSTFWLTVRQTQQVPQKVAPQLPETVAPKSGKSDKRVWRHFFASELRLCFALGGLSLLIHTQKPPSLRSGEDGLASSFLQCPGYRSWHHAQVLEACPSRRHHKWTTALSSPRETAPLRLNLSHLSAPADVAMLFGKCERQNAKSPLFDHPTAGEDMLQFEAHRPFTTRIRQLCLHTCFTCVALQMLLSTQLASWSSSAAHIQPSHGSRHRHWTMTNLH